MGHAPGNARSVIGAVSPAAFGGSRLKPLAVLAVAGGLLAASAIVWARQQRAQREQQQQLNQPPGWGWLGARLAELDEETARQMRLDSSVGVRIAGVLPDSPAAAGGIMDDDVVRRMDEHDIVDLSDLRAAIRRTRPGQTMSVTIVRGGQRKQLDVILGKRPPPSVPNEPELPN